MKRIRSFLLWIFFFIYAFFFLVFTIICSYIFSKKKYDPWLKYLLRLFLKLAGIKVDVIGIENISRDKVYLIMSNHVSIFDLAILEGYIPVLFRGLEADRQFRWPLYGFATKRFGNIPMNRKNPTAAMKSINMAANKLQEGLSMIILPEGHRSLTGDMKPFKKMPFHLAKNCGREIAPIGLSGLFSLKSKGSWLITPGRIQIKFGEPISIEEINNRSIDEIKEITREKIADLIDYV